MAFSCIKASPGKRGLFTLQVCSSHYWYTDYDYATAILVDVGNMLHAKIPVVGARFIPAGAGNTLNVYHCL
ncbi:hypothetical protein CSY19_001914 [Salmonella enterica subsp. enterica serovar Typhi]|uniref:Uncharacterized protein n=1 Tax=Salmonella enterica subsp. enterica serovar Typhi str. CT18 TaxID=220341 RepID=A0A716NPB6_SALTI|nr:hypothetical protein [Salmonella enterica]EBN3398491.1 hypothetical protein [Salmonella enterica subsp. enterica serovar Typhi]HAB6926937.1 hypothetical protein [Salmonella enterica subsp. enterica serovar Typhi str. CT18]EBC0613021.1 hypothetical protein [Salmonella enterica]EBD1957688.1 hypothetical protein [Salmonella enterica]